MNRSLQVSLWAVAALLSACGGGGGSTDNAAGTPSSTCGGCSLGGQTGNPPSPGPSPAPAPGTFNANAAWRNFLTGATTNNWSVSGTASDGSTHTIGLSVTVPQQQDIFAVDGRTYANSDATAVVGVAGLGLHSTTSRSYYDPATFAVAGTRTKFDANSPTCSVATASTTPPTSVTIGATGPLQTLNDLNGCTSGSALTGTSVTTWSVQADGVVNFFCLNTVARDLSNTATSTESDCVEVAEDGTLGTRARITFVQAQPNVTLVAKNY